MGELTDNIVPLYSAIRDQFPAWQGLPGGVIALGDARYGDTFCGGGELVRELYAELGVREVQEMLRLDASETVTPETDAETWLENFAKALRGSQDLAVEWGVRHDPRRAKSCSCG